MASNRSQAGRHNWQFYCCTALVVYFTLYYHTVLSTTRQCGTPSNPVWLQCTPPLQRCVAYCQGNYSSQMRSCKANQMRSGEGISLILICSDWHIIPDLLVPKRTVMDSKILHCNRINFGSCNSMIKA